MVVVALHGGSWGFLGEVWMCDHVFLDSDVVSERFADGSFIMGWLVFLGEEAGVS